MCSCTPWVSKYNCVTLKISSCQVNTTSRREIKKTGTSFVFFVFFLFFEESSRGATFIVAGENPRPPPLIREVKHHVYVNCATWPSFPITCTRHLLFINSTLKLVVSRNFVNKNCFELFLSAHFLFWENLNLNLTFAVYEKLNLSNDHPAISHWIVHKLKMRFQGHLNPA